MKILITGATGLIGTYLLEQLVAKKILVKAIFHESEPKLSRDTIKQVEWVKADVTNISSLQGCLDDVDQVYHCIGYSHNNFSSSERRKIIFIGSQNIINLSIEKNIKKLLYVSNTSILKNISEEGVITEQLSNPSLHQWHDENERISYEVEKEIWRGMTEGLPSIIINPTQILGISYDWHKLNNNLFKYIYQNSFLGSVPSGANGFVTLQNVIDAMILLMQSNIINERFIISAENLSYKDILSLIAKEFKKSMSNKPISNNKMNEIVILNHIAHFFNKNKSILNKEKLLYMNKTYQYDNSKFLKRFKHFEYEPIAQSITQLCQIYKQKFRLT